MGKLQHLMERDSSIHDLTKSLAQSRDGVDLWLRTLQEITQLMRDVSSRLESVEQEVSELEIPDHHPMLEEMEDAAERRMAAGVQSLLSSVADIKRAVQGIRMPEIPQPEKVDLSPILAAIRSMPAPTTVVSGPERPREWEFEVERDRFGLIKCVTAKAR